MCEGSKLGAAYSVPQPSPDVGTATPRIPSKEGCALWGTIQLPSGRVDSHIQGRNSRQSLPSLCLHTPGEGKSLPLMGSAAQTTPHPPGTKGQLNQKNDMVVRKGPTRWDLDLANLFSQGPAKATRSTAECSTSSPPSPEAEGLALPSPPLCLPNTLMGPLFIHSIPGGDKTLECSRRKRPVSGFLSEPARPSEAQEGDEAGLPESCL